MAMDQAAVRPVMVSPLMLEAMLARVTDPVVALDREWCVTYVNPAAAQLFHRTVATLLGRQLWTEVPTELVSQLDPQLQRAMTEQQPLTFSLSGVSASGAMQAHAYPAPEGVTVFLTAVRSATTEDAAMSRRERRYQALIEKSTEFLLIVDADGIVCFDNPIDPDPMGYPPELFMGSNIFDLLAPEDRPAVRAEFDQLIAQPGATRRLVLPVRTYAGSWRMLEMDATNRLQDPAVQGVVFNARDITTRIRRASSNVSATCWAIV
jgi:PAS domain S-box-containing protein